MVPHATPDRRSLRHLALALLGVTACTLPFLDRPVQFDDPLFLWAARRIQEHPFDFYGFSANWFETSLPFPQDMQNPPLLSYWLAGWTKAFGWSEISLHLALLPIGLGALAGIWALARELDAPPVESMLVAAATPAFFVSSTTLMCDVAHLCAWTWAVVLWLRGLRSGSQRLLAGSAAVAAVAVLVKFVAVGLVPLLLVHGLATRRRPAWRLAWLAVPVLTLAAYEALTWRLYGRGHFLGAAFYASEQSGASLADPGRLTSALAFTGGAFLIAAWYAPRLWSGRGLLGWLSFGAAVALGAAWGGWLEAVPLAAGGALRWSFLAQLALLAAIGGSVIWLVVVEAWRDRSAEALLLATWMAGILLFAVRVNWSLNVRSLLPALPVVAVLVARRSGRRGSPPLPGTGIRRILPLALGAVAALLLAVADQRLAVMSRDAARSIAAKVQASGRSATFQGHWGFQWYAEQAGLAALDMHRDAGRPGDLVIVPATNSNAYGLPPGSSVDWDVLLERPFPWLATMSPAVGAGFHASDFGPLPFALGPLPPERFRVLELVVAIRPGHL